MTKTELIIAVMTNVGADVEDRYEAAKALVQQAAGAKAGTKKLILNMATLSKAAQDDIDAGNLDEDAAKIVQRHLHRVVVSIKDTHTFWEQQGIRAGGFRDGLKEAVQIVKKMREVEEKKLPSSEGQELTTTSEDSESRHPGPTLKQQRQAEESTTAQTASNNGQRRRHKPVAETSDASDT